MMSAFPTPTLYRLPSLATSSSSSYGELIGYWLGTDLIVEPSFVTWRKSSAGKPKCEINWKVTSKANVAAPKAAAIWKRAISVSCAVDVRLTLTVSQVDS